MLTKDIWCLEPHSQDMQTGLRQEQRRERRAVDPSLESVVEELVRKGSCAGKGRRCAHGACQLTWDPILFVVS